MLKYYHSVLKCLPYSFNIFSNNNSLVFIFQRDIIYLYISMSTLKVDSIGKKKSRNKKQIFDHSEMGCVRKIRFNRGLDRVDLLLNHLTFRYDSCFSCYTSVHILYSLFSLNNIKFIHKFKAKDYTKSTLYVKKSNIFVF